MIGLMKFMFFTPCLMKKRFLLKSLVLPIGSGDTDAKSEVSDFYGGKAQSGGYTSELKTGVKPITNKRGLGSRLCCGNIASDNTGKSKTSPQRLTPLSSCSRIYEASQALVEEPGLQRMLENVIVLIR
jgi:hypothetical protein